MRLSQRARIVLLAAQGLQNKDIAQALGVGRVQVARWRERDLQFGFEGIERALGLSRVGVIRSPGVGIFRPVGVVPKSVLEALF